jgi:hypothetical protein
VRAYMRIRIINTGEPFVKSHLRLELLRIWKMNVRISKKQRMCWPLKKYDLLKKTLYSPPPRRRRRPE